MKKALINAKGGFMTKMMRRRGKRRFRKIKRRSRLLFLRKKEETVPVEEKVRDALARWCIAWNW